MNEDIQIMVKNVLENFENHSMIQGALIYLNLHEKKEV